MKRRSFLQKSGLVAVSLPVPNILKAISPEPVIGHGDFQYTINRSWGNLDPTIYPVKDCHEMVEDSQGRLIMITNEVKNNILIYDKGGKLLNSWGNDFPGGHGLTLSRENDEEFLFITDYELHRVFKTTLDGRIILTIDVPLETGVYSKAEEFKPTEVAVAPNGDFYVADGYGSQYIIHYDAQGNIKGYFGGAGDGDAQFRNAHGICVDERGDEPALLITARAKHTLKKFSMDGEYVESFPLPGAMINRPVVHGDEVYFSVLRSDNRPDSGFIVILDKDNRVVSCPAGATPEYEKGTPKKLYQTVEVFRHPHDVCVDSDKNLYVPQWNSGKVYPIQLKRV